VLHVGVVATLLMLTLGGLDVARAVALAHRARSAADLSALAGAGELVLAGDLGAACGRATVIADANAARLVSCATDGQGGVVVTVQATSARPHPLTASGRARAGPG